MKENAEEKMQFCGGGGEKKIDSQEGGKSARKGSQEMKGAQDKKG